MSNIFDLKPLKPEQRVKLQKLVAFADQHCQRYGDPSVKKDSRNKKKPCKRLRNPPKALRNIRNNITQYPKILQLYHAALSLKLDAQLDPHSVSEARHQCGVNSCFEETHVHLATHIANLKDKPCHHVIKRFAEKFSKNPEYRTTGTIFLIDVPAECREEEYKDLICTHGCFCNFGEIH